MSLAPQTPPPTTLQHRADIDGLRAVAVLSVVAFHGFPGSIAGGFVGVDIFFVISGFLISTIILRGLERGDFSFIDFYNRRIRRIFPALIVVLVACFAFGWGSLLAGEFRHLGRHILWSAGFLSNIRLWKESGYFDTASETKPLLHLWSLGIEEQFYIVWPLLLWLAWRWRLGFLTTTIICAALSFAINLYLFRTDPVADFYSPFARVWELIAGAILAVVTMRAAKPVDLAIRHVQSVAGALLLLAGFLVVTSESGFPGVWALLPVVGTVLLIGAGPDAIINRFVLSNALFVFFGLISYPLYLWHWPLLSFARILENETPQLAIRTTLVIAAICLAWLTYRFVERPLRFGPSGTTKAVSLAAAMALIAGAGYATQKLRGIPERAVVQSSITPEHAGGMPGFAENGCGVTAKQRSLYAFCARDRREEPKYAMLGDSKAAALFNGTGRTSLKGGRWLYIGGNGPSGAPVPVLSGAPIYEKYQHFTAPAIEALRTNKNIESVAIVAATRALFQLKSSTSLKELSTTPHYDVALAGLRKAVGSLVEAGKQVVLVVDNPTLLDPSDCILRKTSFAWLNNFVGRRLPAGCQISVTDHLTLSKNYRKLLKSVQVQFPENVRIFDTIVLLCDAGQCPIKRDGRMLYSYSDHISDYAAGIVGTALNRFVRAPARPR